MFFTKKENLSLILEEVNTKDKGDGHKKISVFPPSESTSLAVQTVQILLKGDFKIVICNRKLILSTTLNALFFSEQLSSQQRAAIYLLLLSKGLENRAYNIKWEHNLKITSQDDDTEHQGLINDDISVSFASGKSNILKTKKNKTNKKNLNRLFNAKCMVG